MLLFDVPLRRVMNLPRGQFLRLAATATAIGFLLTHVAWSQSPTAMQAPEVKAKLEVQGLYPAVLCGADFDALIRKEYVEYGRVIREANIMAE
jgi:tripartite-type tricarboxylate transporter receptor subunit TctC